VKRGLTTILAALAAMLIEPVIVDSATLQPDENIVEWNGPGPGVEVSFSQGKIAIVRVPATLVAVQNPRDFDHLSF